MYSYFRVVVETYFESMGYNLKIHEIRHNTYLVYFSSNSLIYSKYVSMTTRKYVHIPENSRSDLALPTDGVYLM